MRLLLALALLVTMMQEHKEPAPGWLCANHKNTPADHQCACHRTCVLNEATGEVEEHEDTKCRSWCWRDHCACLSECDTR